MLLIPIHLFIYFGESLSYIKGEYSLFIKSGKIPQRTNKQANKKMI